MRRLILAVASTALLAPTAAQAADPILPLGQVTPGQRCTGLSVIRGTAISSFDVEVLDVLDAGRPGVARILVRVSGPAVDATGLGPGFSGSPIRCPGADGVMRTIGAISETIGEYGGRTALATPIETIIAQPIQPPSGARPARQSSLAGTARARFPGARSLASPLTLGGIGPRLASAFSAAARRAGRTLVASPARTRATFGPQPMVPGAAVSVGLASGDVNLGAVGTVAYESGPEVWVFGHQLDGAGRRSLFLQDAQIHTVINNPIGLPELSTYKLGSPANDLGTVTGDGPAAVTGRVGALPGSFPMRVTVRDRDTGRRRSLGTRIADEGDAGNPVGPASLGLVAGAAVAEAATTTLAGGPARQHGDMCLSIGLRETRRPLRFCNTYAVAGPVPNGLAGAAIADVGAAAAVLDGYQFGTLHPTSVEIGMRVGRGVRQAFLLDADAPGVVRRGRRFTVRLRLRRTGTGAVSTKTIRMRVPRDIATGRRELRLAGAPADEGRDPAGEGGEDLVVLFEDGESEGGQEPGATTLGELREEFQALGRDTGLRASFGRGSAPREVTDDRDLRITGTAGVSLTVRR